MNVQAYEDDSDIRSRSYTMISDASVNTNKNFYIQNFKDPITTYNLVIHCYNNELNKVDDITLYDLEPSKIVSFVDGYLKSPLGIIVLVSIFILLPLINLVAYILIIVALSQILKNEQKHRFNQSQLQNPFYRMIYSEEICQLMSKNHWFFDIQLRDVQGLAFNQQMLENLKSRADHTNSIKFMVYNDKFKSYFTQFHRVKYTYYYWITGLSLGLIAQLVLIILFIRNQ